jgi:hypothetical protein
MHPEKTRVDAKASNMCGAERALEISGLYSRGKQSKLVVTIVIKSGKEQSFYSIIVNDIWVLLLASAFADFICRIYSLCHQGCCSCCLL